MDFKKMVTDKETWIKLGKGSLKLGKVVVVKGTQAVVANGVAKALTTSFDEGLSGVKKLSFDDVIGYKKNDEPKKKGLFSKKNKEDEIEAALEEVAPEEVKEDEPYHEEIELSNGETLVMTTKESK